MPKRGENSEYIDSVNIGRGRPRLIINEKGQKLITLLAGFMCTDEEIADALETTVDTLHNRNNRNVFSECKRKGMNRGKTSLRRTQFKLAEKNAAMAIFLGKNYLGQKDEIVSEVSSTAAINMQTIASLINHPEPDVDIESLSDGQGGEAQ